MSDTASEVWSEGSWWEALPLHPLFRTLSESHEEIQGESKALLCESRGDLFVWSNVSCCLLTTNLKRLQTRRDEATVFQYLHPTALPVDTVLSMSASPSGQHVALCCRESVIVMMLRRQRGPSGEFSGGIPEADCRSTQVAGDLLQAHCLHVVQVKWTDFGSELIVMLTSDGVLRMFSVSQPSVPISSISVSTGLGRFPNVLHLEQEEDIVGFAVWQNRALLLHERMDVQALALKQGAVPTQPFPIYPVSEDNYSGSGCGFLLLETTPPVLVLANDSGKLYHCVYLYQSTEEEVSDEMLSVVEGVALPVEEDEVAADERVRLLPDPTRRDCYLVLNSAGLFQVELPWIFRMDSVLEAGFAAEPGSIVQQLFCPAASVLDVTVVSDQLLGSVAIILLDSYECVTIPLTNRTRSTLLSLTQVPGIKTENAASGRTLFQHIQSLLQVSDDLVTPLQRRERNKEDGDLSQQECLEYMQLSVQQLRLKYLGPQARAKAELSTRIDLLSRRKQRHVEDLTALTDKWKDLSECGEQLRERMDGLRRRSNLLVGKLERLLGLVTTCSPVLSNAEQSMAQELRSIQEQLCSTSKLLEKAQAKLRLGLGTVAGHSGTLSLGAAQVNTLLSALSDDGQHIKAAVQQVKDLTHFANS